MGSTREYVILETGGYNRSYKKIQGIILPIIAWDFPYLGSTTKCYK